MIDPNRLVKVEEPNGSHRYTLDGFPIPSVSSIINGAGYSAGYDHIDEHVRHNAAERGKAVHEASILVEQGVSIASIREDAVPYLESFQAFLTSKKPTTLHCEQMGYSESLYFAGTWDRKYEIDGKRCRVDLKTSSRPSPWWPIQLALYDMCDEETECYALWLCPKRKSRWELIPIEANDRLDALAAVHAYHYRARHGLIDGPTRPRRVA